MADIRVCVCVCVVTSSLSVHPLMNAGVCVCVQGMYLGPRVDGICTCAGGCVCA